MIFFFTSFFWNNDKTGGSGVHVVLSQCSQLLQIQILESKPVLIKFCEVNQLKDSSISTLTFSRIACIPRFTHIEVQIYADIMCVNIPTDKFCPDV